MRISRSDVHGQFVTSYYQRGERYYRQGRVRRVDWFADDNILESEVLGSELYEQTIEIDVHQGQLDIQGECSCPVGFNCKHVVAALLAFTEQSHTLNTPKPKPQTVNPLEAWQQGITQVLQAQSARTLKPQASIEQVLYILQPQRSGRGTELFIEAIRARRLKKGGYGKAMLFNLASYAYHGSYHYQPAYIQDVDLSLLKWLALMEGSKPKLEGEDGAALLKRLVQTGRCFLGDHTDQPALQLDAPRSLTLSWVENDQGLSQLRCEVEGLGDNWVFCPTDPPWYIDPDQYHCGPLLGDDPNLSGLLLDRLRHLPPVAQADLPQLARYLLELLPANLLPLPVELPLQEIAGEPTPVLRLWGRAQSGAVMSLFARLEFDYQGVRTAPMIALEQAFSLHWQDGEEYRIQHDAAAETAAMAQLVALEFEPVAATDERQLDVHFPMADDAQQALRWKLFIDQALPELEQQGWLIEYGADFRLNVVQPSQWQSKLDDSSGEHWFDLALSIQVGEQDVQLLPLLTNLLEQLGRHTDPLALLDEMGSIMIALEPGLWLQLPAAQLRPVVAILIELYDGLQPGDKGQIQLPRAQAASLNALELALQEQAITLQFQGGEKIRELGQKLTQFDGIKTVEVPANLQAELRPYQQTGLDWLQFLREYGFGGILADDMGLGKTVQTLAHILIEKNAGRLDQPVLVIAPTSVVSNWRREAERFAPQLRVLVLHGSQRKKAFERIDEHDMVLSTYPLLTRDHKALQQQRFHSIILDEAQYIKNAKAKTTQIVNQLRAEHRLCLTGTPLENNLSELWSQFNFLMPGFLSDASRFTRLFRSPIEKERDRGRQRELNRRIKPFILRRTKQQVASELPPKTEIIQRIQLGQEQALLYESIRVAMEQRVRELLQDRGLARSRIAILDALLKLRQACCDPRLVKLPTAAKVKQSAKLAWLMEMLPELLAEGRRVLIFSQFVTMLTLIEAELNQAGIDYSKLTGRTRKRDDAIALFQDGGVPVFLISLKAGGVGLNLTAADTVIVYDPWWNPATEQQAIDRAYRIGQDKPVFVYKLIAEQSVEEKILILQQRKQALADALYEDGENGHMPLNAEELLQLFQPLSAG